MLTTQLLSLTATPCRLGKSSLLVDRGRQSFFYHLDSMLALNLAEAVTLTEGIATLGEAQLDHFADTIFSDLDYPASALVRAAAAAREPTGERLASDLALIAELYAIYGARSPMQFRYTHDFVYGFDWAQWVALDPGARAGVGPFDRAFLEVSRERGHALLARIEADDPRYGKLEPGVSRNPFRFSREPDDERRLCEDLAARDLLPVRAWDADATPRWDQPFRALRDARAEALGLTDAGGAAP